MEYAPQLAPPTSAQETRNWPTKPAEFFRSLPSNMVMFFHAIRTLGISPGMSSYDKSKLGIFNLLNFCQLITGMIIPVMGLIYVNKIPFGGWMMACLPALV